MKKIKSVDPTGKITITQSEERHPYSSEILMRHGFYIIFLNMALGLLPVTIWGNRMKYFKCSISQLYTTLFCICFIVLSVIFVPVVFFPEPEEQRSMTNLVILMSMGMVHVLGYICLLIRGHFVARKIPYVWEKLSKLVQIAVLDVYGKKCYLFREASSFANWAVWEYLAIMFATTGSTIFFSLEYENGLRNSIEYYKLNLFYWPEVGPNASQDGFSFQRFTFTLGYFVWTLCSSSHVLVTMFLCYIVIMITVCLKSVNQQIGEFIDKFSITKTQTTCFVRPKVRFERDHKNLFDHGLVTERFDVITKVILITEEIMQSISLVWGISLIIEALILIAAGTVNTFDFLSTFQKTEQEEGVSSNTIKFTLPAADEWLGIFVTFSTHFYFLFKLTSTVNKMIDEANKSLHLLKQTVDIPLPQNIRAKVSLLKHDLSSTNIVLTATNFFQVNKFLITSITSQIATYVIVLLQFAQQERSLVGSKPK